MNSKNTVVPTGISGRPGVFDVSNVTLESLANEVALSSLGSFEELKFKVNCNAFQREIRAFESDWVEYLPRTDRANNRQGLVISNLEGCGHRDNPSLAQASIELGRRVSECEFNHLTELYHGLPSLHKLLSQFDTLGRTFLVRSGIGGYFMPHRDHHTMPRETFRVAVFLEDCGTSEYDWIMGADRKVPIEMGRPYYVNTMETHRTMSWAERSTHLIMSVPNTSENVAKVIAMMRYSH